MTARNSTDVRVSQFVGWVSLLAAPLSPWPPAGGVALLLTHPTSSHLRFVGSAIADRPTQPGRRTLRPPDRPPSFTKRGTKPADPTMVFFKLLRSDHRHRGDPLDMSLTSKRRSAINRQNATRSTIAVPKENRRRQGPLSLLPAPSNTASAAKRSHYQIEDPCRRRTSRSGTLLQTPGLRSATLSINVFEATLLADHFRNQLPLRRPLEKQIRETRKMLSERREHEDSGMIFTLDAVPSDGRCALTRNAAGSRGTADRRRWERLADRRSKAASNWTPAGAATKCCDPAPGVIVPTTMASASVRPPG